MVNSSTLLSYPNMENTTANLHNLDLNRVTEKKYSAKCVLKVYL